MDPVGFEFVEVLSANRVIFREAENGFLFALRLFLFERKSFIYANKRRT